MKVKKILALMLILVMVLSLGTVAAFADDGDVTGQSINEYEYDPDVDPEIAITKNVATGKGVTPIPGLTYKFDIETVARGTEPTIRDGAPNAGDTPVYFVEGKDPFGIVGTQEITPAAGDKITETMADYSDTQDYYKKESAPIVLQNSKLTGTYTGVQEDGQPQSDVAIYSYKITEKKGELFGEEKALWTKDSDTKFHKPDPETTVEGEYNEQLTLSQAEYIMNVYTKWVDANDHTKGRYVFAITVMQTKLDNGTTPTSIPKKNPTPGGNPGVYGDFSQIEFKNDYLKTPVTNPVDPNGQPYQLSKKVTGVDNDAKLLKDTAFTFNVKLTKASGDDATEYAGRLWTSEDGANFYPVIGDATNGVKIPTPTDNAGIEGYTGPYYEDPANPGTFIQYQKVVKFNDANNWTANVDLKNNEKITFPGVPAGTTFETVENDYYTTGVTGTAPATGDAPVYNLTPGVQGTDDWADLKITEDNGKWIFAGTEYNTEAEAKTAQTAKLLEYRTHSVTTALGQELAANYINDGSTGTTPTGIIMQYLPFFVIIALAVIALMASVVVKGSRRNRA